GLRQRGARKKAVRRSCRHHGRSIGATGMKLRGEVAAITGGSRGIGLAIAKAFVKEGAQLALMARDPQALRQAEKELKNLGATVLVVSGDATSEADVRTFA